MLSNNQTADLNILFEFLHDHPLWMFQLRNSTWSKTLHESAENVPVVNNHILIDLRAFLFKFAQSVLTKLMW